MIIIKRKIEREKNSMRNELREMSVFIIIN